MSLNWKEINCILSELELNGAQIQKIVQINYNTLHFSLYGKTGSLKLLVILSAGVCRLHATKMSAVKPPKPLRFAELLNSRIANARIIEAAQIGSDRIIRFVLRESPHSGGGTLYLYVRLWSAQANVILCNADGTIIDAMRRLPKRGEVSGGVYPPEGTLLGSEPPLKEYSVRQIDIEGSFNEKIDVWYAEHGSVLSLEKLQEEANKLCETSLNRIAAALESLHEKETDYINASQEKTYDELVQENKDPQKYFEQYRKAKQGLSRLRDEITALHTEEDKQKALLARLLEEKDPMRLQKMLREKKSTLEAAGGNSQAAKAAAKRPGLTFMRSGWLLFVGRSAAENDELLRRHVKGNDMWLHARDFPGSYIFIKTRAGKTVPLDILLDASNLALFYSKGRNSAKGDIYYTQVKYLRRVKNGPRGLVIPTQEKNIFARIDEERLKALEGCRI